MKESKPEKKPLAALIIASAKPEHMKDKEESSDDSDMEYDQATDEVMQAIKDDDHEALKEALKSFVDLCMYKDEAKESDEEDSYK